MDCIYSLNLTLDNIEIQENKDSVYHIISLIKIIKKETVVSSIRKYTVANSWDCCWILDSISFVFIFVVSDIIKQ